MGDMVTIGRLHVIPVIGWYNPRVNKTAKKPADALHQAGLRRTPMRLAVLKILTRDGQPLSASRILERIGDGIDKVTLYRTLNTLTKTRLLHRVRGDDQIWRYGKGRREKRRPPRARPFCLRRMWDG